MPATKHTMQQFKEAWAAALAKEEESMVAANSPKWMKTHLGIPSPSEEALKDGVEWGQMWVSESPSAYYTVPTPLGNLLEQGLHWIYNVATFEAVDDIHYISALGAPTIEGKTVVEKDPLLMRISYSAVLANQEIHTQGIVIGDLFSNTDRVMRVHEDLLRQLIKEVEGATAALNELSGTIISIKGEVDGLKKALAEYSLFDASPRSHERRARALREQAPGLNEYTAHPCTCGPVRNQIWQIIQHLNDNHHPNSLHKDPWTRERIAEWLESLDTDLTIHHKEEV
jgi:hypothetical protein